MADQTDFKHITVNPADSDDVVIHAGAPTQAPKSQEDLGEPAPARQPEPAERDGAQEAKPSAASKPSPAEPSKKQPKASSYHQTTLEDIQSSKMSKTQIAVIVIALAALAAFVVWYLVFS